MRPRDVLDADLCGVFPDVRIGIALSPLI